MKPTIVLFLLFLVANSCTVEKRLYTRGWNVQWRKFDRVSKNDKIQEDKTINRNEVDTEGAFERKFQNETKAEDVLNRNQSEAKNDFFEDQISNLEQKNADEKRVLTTYPNVESDTIVSKKSHSTSSKRSNPNGRRAGRVVVILGVIFIIVGIAMLLSALEAISVSALLGGIVVGLFFGIIGLLLLFIGLVIITATGHH